MRVNDVESDKKSWNVTEAYQRLDPTRRDGEAVRLILNSAAHRFVKGRKIRVVIAGGNFPQFQRSSGSEHDSGKSGEMRSVKHTVSFVEGRVSKFEFPVVKVDKVARGLACISRWIVAMHG